MNKDAYKHVLQTYVRRPAVWVGLVAELIRTLLQRIWVAIIVAQIATNLAQGDIDAAKRHVVQFFVVYVVGAIIGALGDLVAIRAEDYEYEKLTIAYYCKLTGKDMSFYRDHQAGY